MEEAHGAATGSSAGTTFGWTKVPTGGTTSSTIEPRAAAEARIGIVGDFIMIGQVLSFICWHGNPPYPMWRPKGPGKHWGACDQSCGRCRSHNREYADPDCNCIPCYDAWTLTCVSKQFLKWIKGLELWQLIAAGQINVEAALLPPPARLMNQPAEAANTSTKGVIKQFWLNQEDVGGRKPRPTVVPPTVPGLQETTL